MIQETASPRFGAAIGGGFLLAESAPGSISTPENLPSEARLMARTMEEFVRKEVIPINPRLQAHEPGLMAATLRKAGDLGLLAGSVPEQYGGLGLPKVALTLLSEKAAVELSFAISIGIQSGMSLLPLLYFGTEQQRSQLLPGLLSGEILGAFALSEANSGSDALGAQTKATLAGDGMHYLLNGSKMWTTNGGFADLFTVFVQVDGAKFTAFLVSRDTPGLMIDKEEHKVGLHGSSTCRINLQDARVPANCVLGEVGQGHRPALFALNVGRFNIGATALGAAKEALRLAARYASERIQFGKPLSSFGLVQMKLATMASQIFALESAIYRTAGHLDSGQHNGESDPTLSSRAASEEFAIECAICKVFGTEVMDYAIDEAVQIHGGYGYSEEFPIARMFRDARVFRIFEGTNEINRLTVFDQLVRRARKGRLPLFSADVDLSSPVDRTQENSVAELATRLKRAVLYTFNALDAELGDKIGDEQEVAAAMADAVAAVYAMDSVLARCSAFREGAESLSALADTLAGAFACDTFPSVERQLLVAISESFDGDKRKEHVATVRRLLTPPEASATTLRKAVALAVTGRGMYPL